METHQQNVQLLCFIFHGIVICRHFKQTFAFTYIYKDRSCGLCLSNTGNNQPSNNNQLLTKYSLLKHTWMSLHNLCYLWRILLHDRMKFYINIWHHWNWPVCGGICYHAWFHGRLLDRIERGQGGQHPMISSLMSTNYTDRPQSDQTWSRRLSAFTSLMKQLTEQNNQGY